MSSYATIIYQNGATKQISWKQVREWVRRKYNELRELDGYHSHCSHAATDALELASAHFDLGHGCAGFCDQHNDIGQHGCDYINMGDTYDTTVYFLSDHQRFYVGSYGDHIERSPEEWYQ